MCRQTDDGIRTKILTANFGRNITLPNVHPIHLDSLLPGCKCNIETIVDNKCDLIRFSMCREHICRSACECNEFACLSNLRANLNESKPCLHCLCNHTCHGTSVRILGAYDEIGRQITFFSHHSILLQKIPAVWRGFFYHSHAAQAKLNSSAQPAGRRTADGHRLGTSSVPSDSRRHIHS